MTTFTEASLLAFIAAHGCVPPTLAPVMVAVASWESGLDSTKVHVNPNGTKDWGISQVNDVNFGWTGLTPQTAMDACLNLAAGAKILLAKYNGNPPDAGKITYSNGVLRKIADSGHPVPTTTTEVPPDGHPVVVCAAPPWDTWGQQACLEHTDDKTPEDEKKGDNK